MEHLNQQARLKLKRIEQIADAMIGEALASGGHQRVLDTTMDNLAVWATAFIEGNDESGRKIVAEARKSLSIDLPEGKPPRNLFIGSLSFLKYSKVMALMGLLLILHFWEGVI